MRSNHVGPQALSAVRLPVIEQIILLDYFTLVHLFVGVWWRGDFAWARVSWRRSGFLVASWLVAKLPGGEMTGYPGL